MSATLAANRLKKVMRIALVGIRPGDQVLLKGYLRVLLRLEADLEWVSANSPMVDLFMINQEFRQAESVQRLLASQPNVSVLYVERNGDEAGHLVDNLLTLPLKELDQLNQWLFKNVLFLQINGDNQTPFSSATSTPAPAVTVNASAPTTNSSSTPATPVRQSLDDLIASRAANPIAPIVAPAQPVASQTATPATLVDMLQQIQQRADSTYSIKHGDSVVAYINPKRQAVWVIEPDAKIALDWQLAPVTTAPAIISVQPAQDMVQWLWETTYQHPTNVVKLIQPNASYGLMNWVKPLNDDDRHTVLKIQSVLESRDVLPTELASLAQVTQAQAARSLAALIVAGVMQPSTYSNLPTHLATAAAEPPQATIAPVIPLPTAHTNEALQTEISSAAPASTTQDDGMKGFLSKLRRKLGL